MALTIKLKPGQKIIINGAVLENSSPGTTAFRVLNSVAILRDRDILTPDAAQTPASRVYFALQCAYLFPEEVENHLTVFNERLLEYVSAAPSAQPIADEVGKHISEGQLYQALRAARQLIAHESELIQHVQSQLAEQLQKGTGGGGPSPDGGLGPDGSGPAPAAGQGKRRPG